MKVSLDVGTTKRKEYMINILQVALQHLPVDKPEYGFAVMALRKFNNALAEQTSKERE